MTKEWSIFDVKKVAIPSRIYILSMTKLFNHAKAPMFDYVPMDHVIINRFISSFQEMHQYDYIDIRIKQKFSR